MVDVWNYRDSRIQSQQLYELKPNFWGDGGPQAYTCVININNNKIISPATAGRADKDRTQK